MHRLQRASTSIPRLLRRGSTSDAPEDGPHLVFSEEPLGLPAYEGFSYFQGGPGLTLHNRFELQTKLGFGTTSSVRLARDCIENKHVAVKILTGYSTQLNREKKLRELEVLQDLSREDPCDRSPRLFTQFVHPEIEDDGEHLCLVTELFVSTIQEARAAAHIDYIPVPTAKRILKHVLLGIAHLHKCRIVHTDIKPDNIMIDLGRHWTTEAIDAWLRRDPPQTYAPEHSLKKTVTAFVSQSLPPPTLDELSLCSFKLADFSSAQYVNDQTTDNITPLGLRPPEVVLGGERNESVDIWTFGCTVFTLVTHRPLFKPMASPEDSDDASEIDVLLYQMIIFCCEFFTAGFLKRCSRSLDYFRLDCRLHKFQSYTRKPFEKCLLATGIVLSTGNMAGITELVARCLRENMVVRV